MSTLDWDDLQPVSTPITELATLLWLLTHPDLRRNARIQTFMREIGDALAERLSEVD